MTEKLRLGLRPCAAEQTMLPASIGRDPGCPLPLDAADAAKNVPNELRRDGRGCGISWVDPDAEHAIKPGVRRAADALKGNIVRSGFDKLAGRGHPGIEQARSLQGGLKTRACFAAHFVAKLA